MCTMLLCSGCTLSNTMDTTSIQPEMPTLSSGYTPTPVEYEYFQLMYKHFSIVCEFVQPLQNIIAENIGIQEGALKEEWENAYELIKEIYADPQFVDLYNELLEVDKKIKECVDDAAFPDDMSMWRSFVEDQNEVSQMLQFDQSIAEYQAEHPEYTHIDCVSEMCLRIASTVHAEQHMQALVESGLVIP